MQAENTLPQTPTRRQFLATLAALPLLALPALGESNSPVDPARTATIAAWADEIEQVIVGLVNLHNFVWQARSKQPEQVDGAQYLDLEEAAMEKMDNLCGAMQTLASDGSSIVEALTGQREYLVSLKREIPRTPQHRDFWQAEIDSIATYDPVGASELQAMLDSHFKVEA